MADVPSIKIPLHACAPYAYVTLSSTKPEFMIRQPSHFEANPLTVRYTSSFRSHLSDVRKYVVRRRLWLLGLGSLCCMITIAGIVYSCHVNYVADGGVGWIKYSRSVAIPGKEKFAETFLPVRKFEKFHDNSVSKRDHPGVIPYYECGDQLQSCVAFNQPDICCPITTSCFAVSFTPSGILCCNATNLKFCDYSSQNPPSCVLGTTQCSAEDGGGCCPIGTLCSPNGCVQFLDASIISTAETIPTKTLPPHMESSESSIDTPSNSANPFNMAGQPQIPASTSVNSTSIAINGSAVTPTLPLTIITTTVVEVPAMTITIVKQGEVATGVARKVSVFYALWFPYVSAIILTIIAAIMGML